MLTYRRALLLIVAGMLLNGAAPVPRYSGVAPAFAAVLNQECPTRHLDLLSPGDLRDILDDYKARVPGDMKSAMNRTERDRCRGVIAGASCDNVADLQVVRGRRALPAVAALACSQFETCHGQSDCRRVSRPQAQAGTSRDPMAMMSERGWSTLLTQATAGRGEAIARLGALRRATDGARSEAIDKALSDALMTNPSAVLGLVHDNSSVPRPRWLCQDRAIEPTASEARHYTHAAIAAVRTVAGKRLHAIRGECLASLRRAVT